MVRDSYGALVRQNEDLLIELSVLRLKYNELLVQWNALVERVNKKGGEKFLRQDEQFTKAEIRILLQLCHPDKHKGSKYEHANTMTVKLLEMRNK